MMKARLLKILPLFLIAALVASGLLAVLPGQAHAAKVTYKVTVMDPRSPFERMEPGVNNESPSSTITLINNEDQPPAIASNDGLTFNLVVDTKLKKKKVKIGGEKVVAYYHKVKIPKKSYRMPEAIYWSPMGMLRTEQVLKSDGKGMLYKENGDVDLYTVVKGKKGKTKIGDGKVDPSAREDFQGAMIVQQKTQITIFVIDTGKKFMKLKSKSYMSTGESHLVVQKTKTKLDGLRLPQDDKSGLLKAYIGPGGGLSGQPIDLDAGTGTLVSTSATMKGRLRWGGVTVYRPLSMCCTSRDRWMDITGKRGPGGPRPTRLQERV
jgi:hypothetical protein